MNLFDALVTEALKNQPVLSSLRMVVEKELLHHDILRVMRDQNFLSDLTFIGGTCLRCCYGGVRLSEDLDFTGGSDFSRDSLSAMGHGLRDGLHEKYGLHVVVSEPVKDKNNVDTWKIKIETRPEKKHVPAQRIHIDICAVPSYDKRPMMLMNPYGVDMGTSGLIVQAQSREEIYTDKLIAFALRPNRIKYRDVWDILWLHGQALRPKLELISHKLSDRYLTMDEFLKVFDERVTLLRNTPELEQEFRQEMHRFLPKEQIKSTLEQAHVWRFFMDLMADFGRVMHALV